ncbi:hypothetical protein BEL07_21045 [Mycolicibacterium grossiae]|uniref:Septum formation-related domain-containing protein n=1 Tax=Mycolicibacterium grossiae TaxID=1552759 RepID=A0A1E8Q079_9MYCO|nr:hypothetical protein BEL07_21045 [Mycolicibacterium grossiae]
MVTWPSGDPNQPYGQQPPPPYGPGYPQQPGYPPPPPPPLPYQQGPYGTPYPQGYPPQPPPKKSKKPLIIALVVVGVLAVVGIGVVAVLTFAFKDRVVATDVQVGSCITDVPTESRIMTLPTVDCAKPHGGEVYAVLNMPDGDYPGAAAIDEWQNKCPEELATYSPDAMLDETVGVFVLYPTKETWDVGDRAVTCIATFDQPRTGTLK